MTNVLVRRPILCVLIAMATLVPTIIGGTCGVKPPGGDPPASGLTGNFVGAARCELCHTNIHENWSQTLHAGALETLEAIGQGENPACLPCHTVGYGEEGGFVDRATTNELAGVQCESCHQGALEHVENVSDESLRPVISISADVCGRCHQDAHHPNFEQWSESGHALVTETVAEELHEGLNADNCGQCHSGDAVYLAQIRGETITADALLGTPVEDLNAVTCAVCHNPHQRTGNAAAPDTDRDYQLRYKEVVTPEPTNDISTITNSDRYNLCGRCHRDRGRDWTANSRGPHGSVQSNVYIGEMSMKPGQEPLVPNIRSVHRFVPEQCATCHMFRKDFESEEAPAISGHAFSVDTASCSAVGCHPNEADAIAVTAALHDEVHAALEDIKARLGDVSTWEYSASSYGGPPDAEQSAIPAEIRKVRFMLHYIENDGSHGVHNPAYVRTMLSECDRLLDSIGK